MSKWGKVKLGAIYKISSGGTPSKKRNDYYKNGDIPWVRTGDLKNKYIYGVEGTITRLGIENSSAKVFPKGTVLVAMYGATIGACSILEIEAATNQACAAFLPHDYVENSYLYYFLINSKKKLIQLSVGGAQPNISATILKELHIVLPPLEIQKEIIHQLDTVSELLTLRKKQLEELDLLIKSQFVAMFGDPVLNDKGWEIKSIGDLAQSISYGTSKKASKEAVGYPVLRMNNITYSGEMDLTDLKYVEFTEKDEQKHLVYKDELLFNRTNSKELVGKTAVYKQDQPMAYAGYLVKLIPNHYAKSDFISQFLNSSYGKLTLLKMAKNIVGMANINAKELASIKIYVPPIHLQEEFSRKLEKINAQKTLVKQSLAETQQLFDALMSMYFDD